MKHQTTTQNQQSIFLMFLQKHAKTGCNHPKKNITKPVQKTKLETTDLGKKTSNKLPIDLQPKV
jgi:hypothetical protein